MWLDRHFDAHFSRHHARRSALPADEQPLEKAAAQQARCGEFFQFRAGFANAQKHRIAEHRLAVRRPLRFQSDVAGIGQGQGEESITVDPIRESR